MGTSWRRTPTGSVAGSQPDLLTVGVLVPVPAPFADALQDARAGTGDRVADAVPPHVTLVPPMQVAREGLPDLLGHLRRTASRVDPFAITLLGTGTFRPVSQVVFVQVVTGAQECDRLQAELRSGSLVRPLDFPYHPHVTVGHDVPDDALDRVQTELSGFQAAFDVESVAVYGNEDDTGWQVLAEVELGGDDDEL